MVTLILSLIAAPADPDAPPFNRNASRAAPLVSTSRRAEGRAAPALAAYDRAARAVEDVTARLPDDRRPHGRGEGGGPQARPAPSSGAGHSWHREQPTRCASKSERPSASLKRPTTYRSTSPRSATSRHVSGWVTPPPLGCLSCLPPSRDRE